MRPSKREINVVDVLKKKLADLNTVGTSTKDTGKVQFSDALPSHFFWFSDAVDCLLTFFCLFGLLYHQA